MFLFRRRGQKGKTMAPNHSSNNQDVSCSCGKDCADGDCQGEATKAIDLALSTIDANLVEKRAARASAERITRGPYSSRGVKK